MQLAILAGMALAAAGSPVVTPLHQTTVPHIAAPVTAAYHAATTIELREINTTPATRPGVGSCRWTASVQVQREVAGVSALAKPVGAPTRIHGVTVGLCAGAQDNIDAQIAARIGKIQADLVATAQADRGALVAELDGLARLASAG